VIIESSTNNDELLLLTLDAEKAFNKLNHEILFNNLYHNGIKGEQADWSLAITIKEHLEEETYLPFFFDVVAYGSVESEELKQHIAKISLISCNCLSESPYFIRLFSS
jgi:hypothetical protein